MSQRPRVLWLLAIVAALVVAVALVRVWEPAGTQALVLVSGRDDHGLLRDHQVVLYAAPRDGTIAARIHDGRVARVLEVDGDWLRIRALGEPTGEGWVNDFYLRDRALRGDGSGQVTFAGAREDAGRVWLAVRSVGEPRAPTEWIDAAQIREIGARDSAADEHP